MVLLLAPEAGSLGLNLCPPFPAATTTVEIDLSISIVSTLSVESTASTDSGSSGVFSSKSTASGSRSSSSSSSSGSTCSLSTTPIDTGTHTPIKKSERLLPKPSTSLPISDGFCMWKGCAQEPVLNILEHIQTLHVAPQTKAEGYTCLWEGCKVFDKKSSSLSWIERHVLSHGGNKPFRCIFSGCGLSFGSQGALERHVNSHISTNGSTASNGHSSVARKLDSSPSKGARRKKLRGRKQKLNTGHCVDFFDKRSIEIIKYRLSRAVQIEESNTHHCTFTCQVLSRRTCPHEEPHILVRWYPSILPDEWIPQSKFVRTKSIPFRQLPPDKLRLLFPQMFPPERKEKAKRKWKPQSSTEHEKDSEEKQKIFKSEDIKHEVVEVEPRAEVGSICECCNFQALPTGCKCIPLEPDWVEFLSDQLWS